MALTGIEIFKKLPKTNCGECGVPTCLAFAMKLGQKQAELSQCPYVEEESKAQRAQVRPGGTDPAGRPLGGEGGNGRRGEVRGAGQESERKGGWQGAGADERGP